MVSQFQVLILLPALIAMMKIDWTPERRVLLGYCNASVTAAVLFAYGIIAAMFAFSQYHSPSASALFLSPCHFHVETTKP